MNASIYKRCKAISFCLFFFLATAFFLFCMMHRAEKEPIFLKHLAKEKSPKKKTPIKQMRYGVKKDIYIRKPQNDVHIQVSSPQTMLVGVPKNRSIEIFEEMLDIHCVLDEKGGPQKRGSVRTFDANEGLYEYFNQRFLAQSVFLSFFEKSLVQSTSPLSKTALSLIENSESEVDHHSDYSQENTSSTPFLEGIAKEVTLSLSPSDFNFQAEQFKALVRYKGEENKKRLQKEGIQ